MKISDIDKKNIEQYIIKTNEEIDRRIEQLGKQQELLKQRKSYFLNLDITQAIDYNDWRLLMNNKIDGALSNSLVLQEILLKNTFPDITHFSHTYEDVRFLWKDIEITLFKCFNSNASMYIDMGWFFKENEYSDEKFEFLMEEILPKLKEFVKDNGEIKPWGYNPAINNNRRSFDYFIEEYEKKKKEQEFDKE